MLNAVSFLDKHREGKQRKQKDHVGDSSPQETGVILRHTRRQYVAGVICVFSLRLRPPIHPLQNELPRQAH